MKITVHYQDIHETLEARDANDALSRFKAEVAKRAPMLARPIIKAMGDLKFAGEAVARFNQKSGRQDPAPTSAQEFLDWAVARGLVTIEN